MQNVGFGDCFILTEEDVSLLVDCGTMAFNGMNSNHNDFKDLVSEVKTKIDRYDKKFALLSHFHKDHYKGFKCLSEKYSNIFDKFYIPYIYIDEDNNESILIEYAIYFYVFFGENSITRKLSENILKHIRYVLKLTKNYSVISLHEGLKFKLNKNEFHILWPKKGNFYNIELQDFLYHLHELTGDWKEFHEVRTKIIKNMKKWFTLTLEGELNESEALEINSIQNKLIKRLDFFNQVITYH